MPIYLFWGEDDFAIAEEVKKLQKSHLDPNWLQFNYDKLSGEIPDSMSRAINQAITPVFGSGDRLIWVCETTICQHCSEDLLSQLKQTLPSIPPTTHLVFTTTNKPDGRLKSTKLLNEYAIVKEYSLIPPWKTDELIDKVQQIASEIGVKLTHDAIELLAESVGNNTRQLYNELEKLSIYGLKASKPIDSETVSAIVNVTTQNSLKLASAIKAGNIEKALELVTDLINRNESALKIVATLVGQFRTLCLVKLMIESGEKDDKAIATVALVGNPKRIYFLRKEVSGLSSRQLLATLPILLDLEYSLKRGAEPHQTLQTKIIELCSIIKNR